jgi:hypothetical protein
MGPIKRVKIVFEVTTFFVLLLTSTETARALQAQFINQLQPIGLPAGISFGGGGNSFERRVDLSGSLAVVGAGNFRRGLDQGHAFVFDFSDQNNVSQLAMLRASDNSAGNEYGDGVAISGNYVFVTAYGDSNNRGAVYMYDVSDPANIIERKITAFDAAPANYFGFSLAVDGNKLFVGAPKFSASTLPPAAYVVDFTDPDNMQQAKIVQSNIGAGGNYGEAVAISGNYAIVGHISDSTAFTWAGSAHLYDITNPHAVKEKIIRPTDAPNYSAFGKRVSISGTKALVSVSSDPGPNNNPGASDGTVWAFDFSNWNSIKQSEFGRPVPPFGGLSAPFGRFLDLQENLSVAAAFNEDGGRGAIYFHDVSNVNAPVELLRLPARSSSDRAFGVSLAVDGRSLLVSDQRGHVYLYQLAIPEPTSLVLFSLAIILVRTLRLPRC